MRTALVTSAFALAVLACSSPSTKVDETRSSSDKKDEPAPVVANARAVPFAKIKTRAQTITILGTGGDVRFRVEGENGELVVASATLDELREKAPEAYEIARTAVAGQGTGYVDARLDHKMKDSLSGRPDGRLDF
jgi:hypothetical protein